MVHCIGIVLSIGVTICVIASGGNVLPEHACTVTSTDGLVHYVQHVQHVQHSETY